MSKTPNDATGIVQDSARSGSSQEANVAIWQRYLNLVAKHKTIIAVVMISVLGLTIAWTYSRTPIYRAVATVLVDRQAPQVLGNEVREVVDLSSGSYWENKEYLATQQNVITSMALSKLLVDKLNLVKDERFWRSERKFFNRPKKVKRTRANAASRLRTLIRARVLPKSNIIEVGVEHPIRSMAVTLTNGLVRAYLNYNVEYKLSSTTGAVKWLANQLDDLKAKLRKSELDLYSFKKANNIVSISLEDKRNLITQKIEQLNNALTQAQVKRIELTAEYADIKEARKADPVNVAVNVVMESELIRALKDTYMAEYQKYAAIRVNYLDQHPRLMKQKAKMEAARRDLAREVDNVLKARELEYNEAKVREKKLAGALQRAKAEALAINKKEIDYQRLDRAQKNNARLYAMVLTRLKESDLSSQLRVNNIRMLDAANHPKTPIRPNVLLNLIIGTLLGLLFGVALALLLEELDTTLKSGDDMAQIHGMIFLGTLPRISNADQTKMAKGVAAGQRMNVELVVHRTPKSSIAESCRAIRTNLLFSSPDSAMKSLVVSSAVPREGKTTTAVSLAIAMSQAGGRVLIIDTDMRRPRLHKIFGVPGTEGISTLLLGSSTVETAIKSTEVPNLFVLPCGPTPPNPAEICQSERFAKLLDQLGERFDRLILDSPPLMVVTDAVVLSTMSDGTLLVARSHVTSRVAFQQACRQILDVGGRLVGGVLNDMDMKRSSYGYYRHRKYGYYYRYGQYGQYGEATDDAKHMEA